VPDRACSCSVGFVLYLSVSVKDYGGFLMSLSMRRAMEGIQHMLNHYSKVFSSREYQDYLEALVADCQRRLGACGKVVPAPVSANLPTMAGAALVGGPVDPGAHTLGRLSDEGADVLRQALGRRAEEHP
jgi:hypothetical protein